MKYSQNNEQEIIERFFKGQEYDGETLILLSIGENDGKTLSNSLACIERGWTATLVEPSKKAFKKMFDLHKGNHKVEMFDCAIGNTCGDVTFHESGEHAPHLYGENHSLLSTIKKSETARWTSEVFTETTVPCLDIKTLFEKSINKRFDLISIDAEGLDFEILTQIDLNEIGCKMLIVENNGTEKDKYISYCDGFGMKLFDKTYENLIFIKA
jgi:FkbM family methyltransferase